MISITAPLFNEQDSVHTSRFDFNDANLTVGAAYWTRLVERYLE